MLRRTHRTVADYTDEKLSWKSPHVAPKGLKLIIVQSDLISLWVGWCVDTNMSVSVARAGTTLKFGLKTWLDSDRYRDHNGFREKMFLQLRP